MKGLILSGGRGTRLRPITYTNAKQLIPIGNKPILFYGVEALIEAGIKEIGIVVGETRNEIISAVEEANAVWNIKIEYIYQEEPLGLAHAVKISKDYLGEEPFVMYLGDNLVKGGIRKFVNKFLEDRGANAQLLLVKVDHPEQFGVAEFKDGRIVRLVEKPKEPPSNYALAGIYIFDKSIFEAVEHIKPSWRNELEITDAIQYLIDNKYKVNFDYIVGWWKDTGKVEDLLEANRLVLEEMEPYNRGAVDERSRLEGRVVVEEGCQVINSVVRGPVVIGKNSKIINSYIGPFTSIHYSVVVENSEVEYSIVLAEAKICGVKRISESLIGRNVEIVHRDDKIPVGYRITAGDSSKIEL